MRCSNTVRLGKSMLCWGHRPRESLAFAMSLLML